MRIDKISLTLNGFRKGVLHLPTNIKNHSMKVALRLVLVFALVVKFADAQQNPNTKQGNPPNNTPSENGYIQQSITENNTNLQTLGMNPIQLKEQKQDIQQGNQPNQQNQSNQQTSTGNNAQASPDANSKTKNKPSSDSSKAYIDTTKLPTSAIYGHDY